MSESSGGKEVASITFKVTASGEDSTIEPSVRLGDVHGSRSSASRAFLRPGRRAR